MGLSSQLAPSAIARPGVCTSTTKPASPYEGQVIYETDTDKTLVWNGSAWVYLSTSTANPVGLELVTSQTIGSAVSSVTVSNCFSSTYDTYRVIVSGGVGSTNIGLTVGFSGVSTGFYGGLYGTKYDTGAFSGTGVNNAASWTWAGFADVNSMGLCADLLNVSIAKRKYIASGFGFIPTGAYYGGFAGECTNTSAQTSLVIGTSSGTMTGGTIKVYGYKN